MHIICEVFCSRLEVSYLVVQISILGAGTEICYRVREQCFLGLPIYWRYHVFRSNIREMRAVHKDTFLKKHNLKLGFMSAFVKAAAFALQDQPVVNAGEWGPLLVNCVSRECGKMGESKRPSP